MRSNSGLEDFVWPRVGGVFFEGILLPLSVCFQDLRDPVEGQFITLSTKAANDPVGNRRNIAVMAEWLAGIDIGQVNFNGGDVHRLSASWSATDVCV